VTPGGYTRLSNRWVTATWQSDSGTRLFVGSCPAASETDEQWFLDSLEKAGTPLTLQAGKLTFRGAEKTTESGYVATVLADTGQDTVIVAVTAPPDEPQMMLLPSILDGLKQLNP